MSVLRDVISRVDNTPGVTTDVKEALGLLMKLAEAKAEQYKSQIEKNLTSGKLGDTLEVAITKVIDKKVEYRGVVQMDVAGLANKIVESLKPMFSGTGDTVTKIIGGVASIIDDSMRAIIGTGQGNESDAEMYAITTEYPAIVRFDFAFWGRNIAAQSVKSYVESAFACVAYKSAVDISKLDFNTFMAVYANVLRRAFGDDETKLKDMISQAKDIFKEFGPGPKGPTFRAPPDVRTLEGLPEISPLKIVTRRATAGAF